MISICRKFSFEAAHYLPTYEGKCRDLHGHSFAVEIEITGSLNENAGSSTYGMIMDFVELKKIVEDNFLYFVDHRCLNDKISCPTAEFLCEYAVGLLDRPFAEKGCQLIRLRISETANNYAEWRKE